MPQRHTTYPANKKSIKTLHVCIRMNLDPPSNIPKVSITGSRGYKVDVTNIPGEVHYGLLLRPFTFCPDLVNVAPP